ncbi:hypothetical protein BDV23DRAFT_165129 [Aspergillus alliaceus]|uniref:Uncharacterized protein n=1 Tax=Petromyces alliaceus TaxID=209559 RepID=A0A5N7BU33_PETAA|nr:hypothetical protein BDV23DRAFT_165129 [Aspergillus alliaceus]
MYQDLSIQACQMKLLAFSVRSFRPAQSLWSISSPTSFPRADDRGYPETWHPLTLQHRMSFAPIRFILPCPIQKSNSVLASHSLQ